MAACINALSLALIQTSIPLKASVVAVCTSEVDDTFRRKLLLILLVDVVCICVFDSVAICSYFSNYNKLYLF